METDSESLIMNNNIKKIKRIYKSNIFSDKLKGNLTKNIMNYLNVDDICEFRNTCIFIYNNFIDNENLKIKKLEEKVKNSLLELNLKLKDNKKAFCFSCEIPYSYASKNLTKAIIISNDFYDGKIENKIEIINNNNKIQEIELKNKFKYIDNLQNITIIELGKKNNYFYNFFSLKDSIFKNGDEDNEKKIYIYYYSENKTINILLGELKETEDIKIFSFLNSMNNLPIGLPILNCKSKKLIGYYKGYNSKKKYHEGLYFRYTINNFIYQKLRSTILPKCLRRIFTEINKFNNAPNKNYHIFLNENYYNEKDKENCINLKAIITITDNCPYKGGKFLFEFHFPENYPFKSPTINLINKIYHPNFEGSGASIFHKHSYNGYNEIVPCIFKDLFETWTPFCWTMEILNLIYSILINPSIEPDNIVNKDCAYLMKNDKSEYEKIAKEWTEKYAKEIFINNSNI